MPRPLKPAQFAANQRVRVKMNATQFPPPHDETVLGKEGTVTTILGWIGSAGIEPTVYSWLYAVSMEGYREEQAINEDWLELS